MSEDKWIYGWVILPCFKVRTREDSTECEMICSEWLQKLFKAVFAPFWSGWVHFTHEEG